MKPAPTPQARRKYFCPCCGRELEPAAEECPRCRFSALVCLQKFPLQAPHLTRLIDPEEALTSREGRTVERAIESLEKTFPQIRLHVCLTRLPEGADSQEFGYWIFNACRPVSDEEEQRRYFSLLLVIDRGNSSISVTLGYRLEVFLEDHALKKILSSSRKHFLAERYGRGVVNFVDQLSMVMRAAQRRFGHLVESPNAPAVSLEEKSTGRRSLAPAR